VRAIKRSVPLLLAAILLVVGACLVVLALDVRSWQQSLGVGDARFEAIPSSGGLWKSPANLPGDPARALLGIGDAVAYRQALEGFYRNEVGIVKANGNDLSIARVTAQTELEDLAAHARTATERSGAANMLGVMSVTTTSIDHSTLLQILSTAAADFQQAIREDPANWAAKVNLELVLRLQRPGKSKFGADARGGFGSGGSEGQGVIGGGF
jgi:hypothetical protein